MEPFEPFNMIFQTAEDDLGDTIKPRLVSSGVDLRRVLVIDDSENSLSLADDRIEKAIRKNNAKLMVIDLLQAFLGANIDMNRANFVLTFYCVYNNLVGLFFFEIGMLCSRGQKALMRFSERENPLDDTLYLYPKKWSSTL